MRIGAKGTPYFDFILQLKTGFIRAVCFEPEKKEFIDQKVATCSPLKLLGYIKSPSRYDGTVEELKLDKHCLYQDPSPTDMSFPYRKINTSNIINIKDISSIPSYQLVTVTGKLIISHTQSADTTTYNKVSVTLVEATSSIRINLWDDKKTLVETNYFYLRTDLQVRVYGGRKFLSSTASTIIKPTNSFPIIDAPDNDFLIIHNAVIKGVENFIHYYSCCCCHRKIAETSDVTTKTIICNNCNVTQLPTKCPIKFSTKLVFSAPNHTNLFLTLFDNCLKDLLHSSLPTENDTSSLLDDKDRTLSTLLSLPPLTVTYNKFSKVVAHTSKEDQ